MGAVGRIGRGLRFRLVLLVALAVLPAFGLLLYTGVEQRRTAISNAQLAAYQVVSLAVSEQRRAVEDSRALLVTLAQLGEVRSRDALRCSALFGALLRMHTGYVNLAAADREGVMFCSGLPMSEPVTIADRAYFRNALSERAFAVGEYQIGRVTGRATVNTAHPFTDQRGDVQGVVFAAISLERLNQTLRDAQLPEGSSLTVVDARGTVLVRHPEPEAWVGRAVGNYAPLQLARAGARIGTAEAPGLDGVVTLYGFVSLLDGAGDLFVSVGIPREAATAEVRRLLARNVLALGVAALLAMTAAWYVGGALVAGPVNRLVETTRRLAAGDLEVRAGGPYTGEIGHLARAFDEMAEALRRRDLEIQRAEKLAALGRLAAGVAHELRNPLTVIDARLQLLGRDATVPESAARQLPALAEATDRMKRIIAGLSNYARPAKAETVVLDANDVIVSLRELVGYQARQNDVSIVLQPADTPARVRVERSELMQILVNLAMNAIEAMEGRGGTLTLTTSVSADGSVVIVVSDTGPGIPPEQLGRIWEPFYSTKLEGSGLGLSIVRGLVDKQGGSITVQSHVGIGTTFSITLPAAVS